MEMSGSGVSALDDHGDNIRCVVLSLAPEPRNPELIPSLQQLGLDPKVTIAFDGRGKKPHDLNVGLDSESIVIQYGHELSGPEVACAASHLRIYQESVGSKEEWTLILEEDACIRENFGAALRRFLPIMTEVPTIFTFYAPGRDLRQASLEVFQESFGQSWTGHLYLPPDNGVAYAINEAAMRIAVKFPQVSGRADWPPWAPVIDFRTIYPWPVVPLNSPDGSFIEAERQMAIESATASQRNPHLVALFHHFTNDSFRGSVEFLRPSRIKIWIQYLGGLKSYVSHVAIPHVARALRRSRRKRLSDNPDSPFFR